MSKSWEHIRSAFFSIDDEKRQRIIDELKLKISEFTKSFSVGDCPIITINEYFSGKHEGLIEIEIPTSGQGIVFDLLLKRIKESKIHSLDFIFQEMRVITEEEVIEFDQLLRKWNEA